MLANFLFRHCVIAVLAGAGALVYWASDWNDSDCGDGAVGAAGATLAAVGPPIPRQAKLTKQSKFGEALPTPSSPQTPAKTESPSARCSATYARNFKKSSTTASGGGDPSESTFDQQVSQLMAKIAPSGDAEEAACKIASRVREAIQGIFPGSDAVGLICSDVVSGGSAFGVAVPEIDIVITASTETVIRYLNARQQNGRGMDTRKLQKAAIRACTDLLVASCGFKFRRSAFRGDEPKVTLMAPLLPAHPAKGGKATPVDLWVNCAMPLHREALHKACRRFSDRTGEFMLLVRRWAKERAICLALRGHPSPYTWAVLATHFLQVRVRGGERLLVDSFVGLTKRSWDKEAGTGADSLSCDTFNSMRSNTPSSGVGRRSSQALTPESSGGALFCGFVDYCIDDVNWQGGQTVSLHSPASAAVGPETSGMCSSSSTCSGTRLRTNLPSCRSSESQEASRDPAVNLSNNCNPSAVSPACVPVGAGGGRVLIEDPFEPWRDLGANLSLEGLDRIQEELQRARRLLASGGSLAALLEPWSPPHVPRRIGGGARPAAASTGSRSEANAASLSSCANLLLSRWT